MLAFSTFQAPLYAGILRFAGADSNEIIRGAATLTVASPLIGKVSGYVNDVCRRTAGMKTAGELASERKHMQYRVQVLH